jgi:hypothetical protein
LIGRLAAPVFCDARLPADPRQQVHHAHLMLEHHQRDDVAVRRQVPVEIEPAVERRPVVRVRRARVVENVLQVDVAEMRRRASVARDVPAAPSFIERQPVRDVGLLRAAREHTRYAHRAV